MNGSYFRTIIHSATIAIFIGLAAPLTAQELQLHAQNSSEFSEKANGKSEAWIKSFLNLDTEIEVQNSKFQLPISKHQVLDFASLHSAALELTEFSSFTPNTRYLLRDTSRNSSTLNLELSDQNLQHSTFNIQHLKLKKSI